MLPVAMNFFRFGICILCCTSNLPRHDHGPVLYHGGHWFTAGHCFASYGQSFLAEQHDRLREHQRQPLGLLPLLPRGATVHDLPDLLWLSVHAEILLEAYCHAPSQEEG